jgi:GTP-binding protein Era
MSQRLSRTRSTLADLVEDSPFLSELGGELMRGSPQAREVLGQLRQIVSVVHLRQMAGLLQVEPCSVVVAGPVNAGKSTLLNVLAGRTMAKVAATPGTTTEPEGYDALGFLLIDTPGADEVSGEARRVAALGAIEEAGVVILLLDGSRGITRSDREMFDQVIDLVRRREAPRGEEPGGMTLTPTGLLERRRLVVALNKMDMVPRDEREQVRLRAASDLGLPAVHLLALSARKRRGLNRLVSALVDGAPGMVEALAEVMPEFIDDLAGRLIHRYAMAAATVALTPMPASDVLPLTALQLAMVVRLSKIYGRGLSWKRSREVIPAMAAGVGWRELFRQVAKLVPISGWALSSGIAYAGTYATGRGAQYLLRTGQRPSEVQLARWRAEAVGRRKK